MMKNKLNINMQYKKLNIGLCCIAKGESLYLKDWIEYYKNIGISKIIFFDNSDLNDNSQYDIVNKYNDFILYFDVKHLDAQKEQVYIYNAAYEMFNKTFDYILFFDVDEYIILYNCDNISDLLNKAEYKNANIIYLNWKICSDNEQLHYINKPVIERFITEIDTPDNSLVKSIVKCIPDAKFSFVNPHSCLFFNVETFCVDSSGNRLIDSTNPRITPSYKNAYLRHFYSLSTEEYIKRRLQYTNTFENSKTKEEKINKLRETYYQYNIKTSEKEKIFDSFLKHNKTVYCQKNYDGQLCNVMFEFACAKYYQEQNNFDNIKIHIAPNDINKENRIYKYMKTFLFDKYELCENNLNDINIINNEQAPFTFTELYKFNDDKDIMISGYRQSPYYWNNDRKWVKKLFNPPIQFINHIYNLYNNIDLNNVTAVHVRRTDFLNDNSGWVFKINQSHIELINKLYYNNSGVFLIISDDIEWCKENFIGDNFIFADKKSNKYDQFLVDLYLMTLCKDNIINNPSTFSWWGAYLNIHDNRNVYYFNSWGQTVKSDFDIIPINDNWISVKTNNIYDK